MCYTVTSFVWAPAAACYSRPLCDAVYVSDSRVELKAQRSTSGASCGGQALTTACERHDQSRACPRPHATSSVTLTMRSLTRKSDGNHHG